MVVAVIDQGDKFSEIIGAFLIEKGSLKVARLQSYAIITRSLTFKKIAEHESGNSYTLKTKDTTSSTRRNSTDVTPFCRNIENIVILK